MKAEMNNRFIKYIFVGGGAFLIEFLSFCLLYYVSHISLNIANMMSFITGLLTSFLLNRSWTFAGNQNYNRAPHIQLGMYGTLAGINLLVVLFLVHFLVAVGLTAALSKLVAIGVISIWNFLAYKQIIFVRQPQESVRNYLP
jgi:putative flippase GtrA